LIFRIELYQFEVSSTLQSQYNSQNFEDGREKVKNSVRVIRPWLRCRNRLNTQAVFLSSLDFHFRIESRMALDSLRLSIDSLAERVGPRYVKDHSLGSFRHPKQW